MPKKHALNYGSVDGGGPLPVVLRWWYDFHMTLVIAARCKEGIIVAADGKGTRHILEKKVKEVVEDAPKLFMLSDTVAVLAFGAAADVDKVLHDFTRGREKEIDLEMCKSVLPGYLAADHYVSSLTPGSGGYILAGYQGNKGEIYGLRSDDSFEPKSFYERGYLASDKCMNQLASKRLSKLDLPNTPDVKVAKVCVESIFEAAGKHSDKVNKNVRVRLITPPSDN